MDHAATEYGNNSYYPNYLCAHYTYQELDLLDDNCTYLVVSLFLFFTNNIE